MTYNVVVLIEREMSEGDARRVAALHARYEEPVEYHLLVSSHPETDFGGPMALLGSSFADVAGVTRPRPPPGTTQVGDSGRPSPRPVRPPAGAIRRGRSPTRMSTWPR
ncbi:hypothetical protein [Kribbella swartbergensis]